MYPIVATGAAKYDVVCPSDYMIQKMIDEELLLPLNYDNIPNISNIDPEYLKSAENFDPGNLYSVPYCWGTVGILYNKTMVSARQRKLIQASAFSLFCAVFGMTQLSIQTLDPSFGTT